MTASAFSKADDMMNDVMSKPEIAAALRMNSFANSVVFRSKRALLLASKLSTGVVIFFTYGGIE